MIRRFRGRRPCSNKRNHSHLSNSAAIYFRLSRGTIRSVFPIHAAKYGCLTGASRSITRNGLSNLCHHRRQTWPGQAPQRGMMLEGGESLLEVQAKQHPTQRSRSRQTILRPSRRDLREDSGRVKVAITLRRDEHLSSRAI